MPRQFILIFVLLWGATTLASADVPVQKVKARNGLVAWLVSDHSLPLITVKLAWRGGALADPKGQAGMASLMAALMSEGAGNLPATQFQQALDDKAIRLSFSANTDTITASLRCLSVHRAHCFELLRLAVTAPRFDGEVLERRRTAKLAALKRRSQSATTLVRDNFYEMAFANHPYGRPVDGTAQGLAAITQDTLKAHHHRHIARDNLLLAVVGDIAPRDLRQEMNMIFAQLPARATLKTPLARPPANGPFHKHHYRAGPQTTLLIGHAGIDYDDADFIPAFVMNQILGGSGFPSRLSDAVREKRGLAYNVTSYLLARPQANLWLASVASDNRTAAETLALIRHEMVRMQSEKLSPENLEAAKTFMTGAYALRFDSGDKIANQLLGVQLNNFPVSYFTTRNRRIRAVTARDIRAVAQRLLRPDALLVSSVGGNDFSPVIVEK